MSRRWTGRAAALILANMWPEKVGKGLMFISLNVEPDTHEAAIDALRAEFEAKGVPVKDGSWGNRLFFNYPHEIASS